MELYTLKDLFRDFSTHEQCLKAIVALRWPDGIHCDKCGDVTRHHYIPSRKAFVCQHCKRKTSPTAGTILHATKVPLPDWMYVIFTMASTRTGVAAKQIQRELGLSYPTALRMCNLVRTTLKEDHRFDSTCEVDETYIGNKRKWHNKRGRGTTKQPVVGVVEKGGAIVARVVLDTKRDTVMPIIKETVEKGVEIQTDEYNIYDTLSDEGYEHDTVKHKDRQYVKYRADGSTCHLQEIEGFWSYPKNAVKGVHRGVSDGHLQGYVNEYAFRQSHRHDEMPLFFSILRRVVQAPPHAQAA